ncbi:UNVERIFIED_CONTAM: hypothetical protein K2H54_032638 [Gekko kuhli]
MTLLQSVILGTCVVQWTLECLIVDSGNRGTKEGTEEKVNGDIEPLIITTTSWYLDNNKVNTEILLAFLSNGSQISFMAKDDSEVPFGLPQGNNRECWVTPKRKSVCAAHWRKETEHACRETVAEMVAQLSIPVNQVNVAGLMSTGSTDTKDESHQSEVFDLQLPPKVRHLMDFPSVKSQEEDKS